MSFNNNVQVKNNVSNNVGNPTFRESFRDAEIFDLGWKGKGNEM